MTQDLLTHAPQAISSPGTPAGWYADPSDESSLRWWSGAGWTEHTASACPQVASPAEHLPAPIGQPIVAAPAVAPVSAGVVDVAVAPAHAPVVPMSRRQLRELEQSGRLAPADPPALFTGPDVTVRREAAAEAGLSPAPSDTADTGAERHSVSPAPASGLDLRDDSGYVEQSVSRAPISVFTPLWPTRVHTVAVWLIAVLPLLLAVAEEASSSVFASAPVSTVRLAAVACFVVLSGILAIVDRQMLRAGGHSDTASPWWVLLSPFAYLIVRSVRVRQETSVRSTGAVLVWLVAFLPAIAAFVGLARLEALIPSF